MGELRLYDTVSFPEDREIVQRQLDFHRNGLSGCKFVQHVAQQPESYDWKHIVVRRDNQHSVTSAVSMSQANDQIGMLSIMYPFVRKYIDLVKVVNSLVETEVFQGRVIHEENGLSCVQLVVPFFGQTAWVSGFGRFGCFPITRQAPCMEFVFRVRERPDYPASIQPPPPAGQMHVADLEVPDVSAADFARFWKLSFRNTKTVLGHRPNIFSAAKTSIIMPHRFARLLDI